MLAERYASFVIGVHHREGEDGARGSHGRIGPLVSAEADDRAGEATPRGRQADDLTGGGPESAGPQPGLALQRLSGEPRLPRAGPVRGDRMKDPKLSRQQAPTPPQ